MSRTFRNEVIAVLQDLYDNGPAARVLLIRAGYPRPRIPAFSQADTFWTEVVIQLDQGILIDGIRTVLTAAAADNPGNTEVARLLGRPGGAPPAVLALLSDPARGSKLRLDREARLLQEAEVADRLTMVVRHATRVSDIVTALRHARPTILHFGGHGMANGNLIFEDDSGTRAEVALPHLADAIAATARVLECVVLNSCYTAAHAEAFRGVTRSVAGSVDSLPDDTALSFVRGFYGAVGAGEPAGRAFEQGRAEARLPGQRTAGLHFADFSDAAPAP